MVLRRLRNPPMIVPASDSFLRENIWERGDLVLICFLVLHRIVFLLTGPAGSRLREAICRYPSPLRIPFDPHTPITLFFRLVLGELDRAFSHLGVWILRPYGTEVPPTLSKASPVPWFWIPSVQLSVYCARDVFPQLWVLPLTTSFEGTPRMVLKSPQTLRQ